MDLKEPNTQGRGHGNQRGAVHVEFLVALLPFLAVVFCLAQLGFLYLGGLAVQRSAGAAARAAMVILDEDPNLLPGARNSFSGARREAIETAASIPLLPLTTNAISSNNLRSTLDSWRDNSFLDGRPAVPGLDVSMTDVAGDSTFTVTIKYQFPCRVPLARYLLCSEGSFALSAQSSLPNHATDYTYGQW